MAVIRRRDDEELTEAQRREVERFEAGEDIGGVEVVNGWRPLTDEEESRYIWGLAGFSELEFECVKCRFYNLKRTAEGFNCRRCGTEYRLRFEVRDDGAR